MSYTQTGGNVGKQRGDVRVTVEDLKDGTTESALLQPDSYIVICGEKMEIAHETVYSNGTRVFTLKRKR